MNLQKWINDKKNRNIIVGMVAVLAVVGLLLSVTRQVYTMLTKVEFPDGIMTDAPVERPTFIKPDYLASPYLCEGADMMIYLPGTVTVGDKTAKSTYEGITFVLLEKSQDPLRLNKETLPSMVNMPIVGYKPEVEFNTGGSGYLYDFVGDFYSTTVKTKVSTKEVTTYALCYHVRLSAYWVALYASVEDPKLLERADELLSQVILSMEEYDNPYAPTEEDLEMQKELEQLAREEMEKVEGKEPNLYFDVTVDGDGPYDNAALVLEWINVKAVPVSIEVTGPNGQKGVLNEEYSLPGHYVFEFGYATAGEYHIVGETEETLQDCEIGVSSWEGYMDVNHYYDNPENIRPREG